MARTKARITKTEERDIKRKGARILKDAERAKKLLEQLQAIREEVSQIQERSNWASYMSQEAWDLFTLAERQAIWEARESIVYWNR